MFLVDEIAGREAQKIGPAKTEKLTISVRELLHIRVELELSARQELCTVFTNNMSAIHPRRLRHS